ncbi:PilZ domain-containing protein [Myxococcota bacterium]|nr:PilZ domain-containing protein [Myxococcota bacterium]
MRGQRGHRANLAVKVGVEYGTTFFTGFSGNVSKGGVFVATHQTLPLGARVELFFEMPDGHAVSVPATVRWGRDVEQAALDGSPPGLGFSFVSLTHDDAIILERYIAAHAQSVLYDEANPPGRA